MKENNQVFSVPNKKKSVYMRAISAVVKIRPAKKFRPVRYLTHDLCDTDAVRYVSILVQCGI